MRTQAEIEAERIAGWALAERDRIHIEATGQVFAKIRKQLRAEKQAAVAELCAGLRGDPRAAGQVVDLPALPLRRKSDAA